MGRWGSRIALWAIALGLATGAAAQTPAIQFAEPVSLSLKSSVVEFDAYGRRFSLSLTDNERVLQKLPVDQRPALASYRLLRGSLAGAPGSWVRLTDTPRGVEGAIWDGREFYAVTRYDSIAPFLTTAMDAEPGQTVVYRLSDARDALPQDFCALSGEVAEPRETTALDQYNAIVAELQAGELGPSITRQIEISLIADTDFQQAEASDPTAAMLARLNIVEGIFSEQIGLLIMATDVRLMSAGADPFTSTKGSTLLEQLSSYRSATAAVRARGLAHLMTGKDLDGTTAGIAYVRTVCDRERAVSLSQRSYGTTISALIMAHELGHNLGAEHDGEAGTPCASVTGSGFIMAPSVSGYGTFSQCSIDTMQPVIESASCIAPAQYADVAVETPVTSVSGEGGVPFTLPFVVRSLGNRAVEEAVLTVTLPASASVAIESAGSTLGSCSVSGLTATCSYPSLAVGESASVSLIARGTTAAAFTVQARVTAANDRLTSNNNRQLSVALRSGIDARVTVNASTREVAVGTPIDVYVDVSSLRALAVRNATLSLTLNQPVTRASLAGGDCTINASAVSCTIAEISSGTTRRLTVTAMAQTAGWLYAAANVSASGDGDLANNSASNTAWVQAERDIELLTSAMSADLDVNAVHEMNYLLRSRGPLPTGAVSLLVSLPSLVALDLLDTGGAPCTPVTASSWRCEFGMIAAGTSRAVRLRVHGTAPVTGDVSLTAIAVDDGFAGNNADSLQLRIDHRVDLGIVLASGGAGVEDLRLEGQVTLHNGGRQAISDGTLEIRLHSAGVLRSAGIHNGAACTMLSDTHARCELPLLALNANLYVDYAAEFAEPGDYDVAFSAAAAGDSAPANDNLVRAVLVRPFYDAGVSGSLGMDGLLGGQTRVKNFTMTTDRRGLASARFRAAHAPPALSVEAISAGAGDCRVDADLGGICDFTDLPANSSIAVSVTYRAADGSWLVEPVVSVSTPGDVLSANDSVTAKVEILGSTDVDLRVAGNANGFSASTLDFPLIELVNGAHKAITPRLELTLPPQITVVEVSAIDAMCTGTGTLYCDFNSLEAFGRTSLGLTLRASAAGRFTATVRVITANDTNPANDSREVSVEIASTTVAATSESSGGGGRLDWLALFLLALLKWGHSSFSKKRGQGSIAR